MKRTKRVFAFVAVLIMMAGGYAYTFGKETGQMKALDTKELAEGIYVVKDSGFVNMYLIRSGNRFIAVDTGQNPKNVKKQMDSLGIAPEKVTAVLQTHTDRDHVGGISLFGNAKVYISSAEEQMINGKRIRMAAIMKNSLPVPYTVLNDGDEIGIEGLTVKGVLTPGHTPGSMSYLIDNRYLFTGDTLSLKDGKAGLFNGIFNMDSELQGESIRKLAFIDGVEYLFTAHYGYTEDFNGAMALWK